jgi:hypothetical protein
MLRNYADHAQFPKSPAHSVHKMQGKAIWRTLQKLLYWSSFVEPWPESHICEGYVDQSSFHGRTINAVYRSASIGYVHGESLSAGLSRLVSDVSGRYVHEIVHGHTHAQNGFTDNPKQTAWTLFHGCYFIDTDETRFLHGTFFYCCTSPQIPLHTVQKNRSHVHNSAGYMSRSNFVHSASDHMAEPCTESLSLVLQNHFTCHNDAWSPSFISKLTYVALAINFLRHSFSPVS